MDFRSFLQNEAFDNVSDFLLNPQHRDKTWSELMKEFEASGGSYIGGGRFGQVFEHPNWPYVLKTFKDDYYLRFVRFAYRNPHPSFPRFLGQPQRIIPFYRRSADEARIYIIRMEKLHPVQDRQLLQLIRDTYDEGIAYFDAVKSGQHEAEYEREIIPDRAERKKGAQPQIEKVKRFRNIFDIFQKHPQLRDLFEGIWLVVRNIKAAALDIHGGNIMQRDNGQLVLIDPVWGGSSPYEDARRMMDMEIGAEPEYQPEDVIGGKLPVRKKPIRQPKPFAGEEVPF